MSNLTKEALEALRALHDFKNPDCQCPRCASLRAVNAIIINSTLPPRLHVAAQYHIIVGMAADVIGASPRESRKATLDLTIEGFKRVYEHSLLKDKKN